MFVCICNRVNDKEITAAISSGANTLEDIADITCAGTTCGRCHDRIRELLSNHSNLTD